MNTAYITHPDCLKHKMTEGHPEEPRRLLAIQDHLHQQHLWDFLEHYEAKDVDRFALSRVHSQQLIDNIFEHAPQPGQKIYHIDPDTFMNEFTLSAALKAAGAGIEAVDLVMQNKVKNAFCAVRPPGHHAERNASMGFCFFNNIAVATAYLLEQYQLERVAIIDFDVHHGNGTENIFDQDPRVLICSSYQHPFYPFSGAKTLPGHLINTPLKAGTSGADFRLAVEQQWLTELESFKPQFIFISAGFDADWQDDMSNLQFNETDYRWVTQAIVKIAKKYADNRIVSMLEGGYSLDALARDVEQHLRVLMGLD